MKHSTLTALVMLTVWGAAGGAQAADAPARTPVSPAADAPVDEAAFRVLDLDRDGYISRLEVRRGSNLERQFDQLDMNRDGRLSREELRGLTVVQHAGR